MGIIKTARLIYEYIRRDEEEKSRIKRADHSQNLQKMP